MEHNNRLAQEKINLHGNLNSNRQNRIFNGKYGSMESLPTDRIEYTPKRPQMKSKPPDWDAEHLGNVNGHYGGNGNDRSNSGYERNYGNNADERSNGIKKDGDSVFGNREFELKKGQLITTEMSNFIDNLKTSIMSQFQVNILVNLSKLNYWSRNERLMLLVYCICVAVMYLPNFSRKQSFVLLIPTYYYSQKSNDKCILNISFAGCYYYYIGTYKIFR